MSSSLPPVPPRPDLAGALSPDRWHVVSPGGMKAPAIVGAGLRLWSGHWLRWGVATFVLLGIANVVVAAIDPWVATYGARWGYRPAGVPEPDPLAALIEVVAMLFLLPWLYVILTKAALDACLDERHARPMIGRTIRGIHSVLWIFFLLGLCVLVFLIPVAILVASTQDADRDAQEAVVGVFGLVFLGLLIWIAPRLLILIHVFVGEDRPGSKAIRETWRRSRGAWGTALGVLVLNILVAIGIGLIPGIVAEQAFSLPTVEDAVPRAVLYAVVSAIVTPIGVAVGAALYLELSARRGVLDQSSLRRNLARFDAG
jgi:hypothetical protein